MSSREWTVRDREIIAAAMDRILPEGDGPGAASTHAIEYVDWLARQPHYASSVKSLQRGIVLLNELARECHGKDFLGCTEAERDALLERMQQVPHSAVQNFFVVLIRSTLGGFLCPPHYGGNKGRLGWAFIGFRPVPDAQGVAETDRCADG